MFEKLLIANRGEIACRVIKTARRMGIKTVAIYSEADRRALHVDMADEAIFIGPAPSNESYLKIENIVEACHKADAEAVHPGYGFLAENAEFAERLAAAALVFIGPPANAIRMMGDKVTAKNLATEAGVSTIPGSTDAIASADEAVTIAGEIGYPVMIKACAGGGGKGMRIARNDTECRDGFQRATGEARTAFGDARVFVEQLIEQPRHIEIQVLADRHGNVIHLGERECSLQRRHQKLIEESPSPLLDEATRRAMGEQAVALAKAVDYQSVGTVEFIVDAKRNFYFLEMNTRLQVEHPVTEFVTGLDLVELMICIAAGESLPITQDKVKHQSWAIEARVCAEDPARNFLPSAGRLVRYLPPAESDSLRVDSGVYEGDEVSIHYDSLMAKLIAHGQTREGAIERLQGALNEFYVGGVSHNLNFLFALIAHSRFRSGQLSTNMIAEEFPDGYDPAEESPKDLLKLIAVAAVVHSRYEDRAASISGSATSRERTPTTNWVAVAREQQYAVQVAALQNGAGIEVVCDGLKYRVDSDWQFGRPLFRGAINDSEICLAIEPRNTGYRLLYGGAQLDVKILTPSAAELIARVPEKRAESSFHLVLSPMPGLLVQLMVVAGQKVKRGQDLAVIEAMKMENVLRAERDGAVARLLANVGDTLTVDQPILEFAGSASQDGQNN